MTRAINRANDLGTKSWEAVTDHNVLYNGTAPDPAGLERASY
jgi:predicted lactoylglutathione lyase